MIRIIAGTKKGKLLLVPGSARPITDRIKSSIFDLIKEYIKDATVLDLFSGSGNFAIESLSRGAKQAIVVELDEKAIDVIKKNVHECSYKFEIEVIKADCRKFLKNTPIYFDIIMLDPPFKVPVKVKKDILKLSITRLGIGGVLIFRYPVQETYTISEDDAKIVYTKKYGASKVSFIVKSEK